MSTHQSSLTHRLRAEHGASVISLLGVVATLAIIAALAIPALKGSGSTSTGAAAQGASATAQAQDVQATNLLSTAQTAMATYAASNDSGYQGVSAAALQSIEPTLITSSRTEAYVAQASGTATDYTVTVVNPLTANTFTLSDNGGAVTRTCTVAGRGGCGSGGTW